MLVLDTCFYCPRDEELHDKSASRWKRLVNSEPLMTEFTETLRRHIGSIKEGLAIPSWTEANEFTKSIGGFSIPVLDHLGEVVEAAERVEKKSGRKIDSKILLFLFLIAFTYKIYFKVQFSLFNAMCGIVVGGKAVYGYDSSCGTGRIMRELVDASFNALEESMAEFMKDSSGEVGNAAQYRRVLYGGEADCSREECINKLTAVVCCDMCFLICFLLIQLPVTFSRWSNLAAQLSKFYQWRM